MTAARRDLWLLTVLAWADAAAMHVCYGWNRASFVSARIPAPLSDYILLALGLLSWVVILAQMLRRGAGPRWAWAILPSGLWLVLQVVDELIWNSICPGVACYW